MSFQKQNVGGAACGIGVGALLSSDFARARECVSRTGVEAGDLGGLAGGLQHVHGKPRIVQQQMGEASNDQIAKLEEHRRLVAALETARVRFLSW